MNSEEKTDTFEEFLRLNFTEDKKNHLRKDFHKTAGWLLAYLISTVFWKQILRVSFQNFDENLCSSENHNDNNVDGIFWGTKFFKCFRYATIIKNNNFSCDNNRSFSNKHKNSWIACVILCYRWPKLGSHWVLIPWFIETIGSTMMEKIINLRREKSSIATCRILWHSIGSFSKFFNLGIRRLAFSLLPYYGTYSIKESSWKNLTKQLNSGNYKSRDKTAPES